MAAQRLRIRFERLFRRRPESYRGWFDPAFSRVLAGLGTSYYQGDYPNRAIHTDLFSPIATDPTWSRLGASALYPVLQKQGIRLWRELIQLLQPDIIIASMRRDGISQLGLSLDSGTQTLDLSGANGRTKTACFQTYRLSTGKKGLLLSGCAGRKPMNAVGPDERQKVGEALGVAWNQLTIS